MVHPDKPDPGIERASTDAGLTGDKVAVSDPAAVPVQGDAEAAGSPTSKAAALASVARQEAMKAKAKTTSAPFSAGHDPGGHGSGLWLGTGALIALTVGGIVAGWISVAGL